MPKARVNVEIQQVPVHRSTDPARSFCWAPVVNGKVAQLNGEPPFSIAAAKRAAAKHLDMPITEINFKVVEMAPKS